jgi:hypothetical protein
MIFCCDDKMESEIDPRASLGGLAKFLKYRQVWIGAHHIGDEGRDAAKGGGRSFASCILRHAWAGDIHAVAKMDMGIHRAWQDRQAGHIDIFPRVTRAGGGNGAEPAIRDQDIAFLETGARQEGNTAPQGKIGLIGHS